MSIFIPGAINITRRFVIRGDCAALTTCISSPFPSLLPGKLISFLLQTLQTVGRRTYCENVYLSGRHRQQWLCVRIIIQTCSSHRAETERLLSIWPLGGCTPSVLEGDTTTATHLFLKLITREELHFQGYLFL